VKIEKKYSTLLLGAFTTLAVYFWMALTMTIVMIDLDLGFFKMFVGDVSTVSSRASPQA
jgi:hypothetical protein